jgi:pyruvate dehydrogenase E1 component alpha subunit
MKLGALADPHQFIDRIDLRNEPTDKLLGMLESMLRIRLAEESVAELVESGEARAPCHLGIGQEAVAVGVSDALRASDRVYGTHRSHPHYLALGGDLNAMMAEILGKATGASRGMGGSMHLYAPEVGFHGSVPIVGATIPIAVGAAIAAKMDGRGDVAVAYFGDGACEEGVLHESLNLAAVMKLPIVFVCENNLYSSHLDITLRQPYDSVGRFADVHGVERALVDGNDVVAVAGEARRLVEQARSGGGPAFLEAVTFRWRGHVGPNIDIDVGVRRSIEELNAWKQRDPVRRLSEALVADRGLATETLDSLAGRARKAVEQAVAFARSSPYPDGPELMDFVYAPVMRAAQ